jgi:hypothetical protein
MWTLLSCVFGLSSCVLVPEVVCWYRRLCTGIGSCVRVPEVVYRLIPEVVYWYRRLCTGTIRGGSVLSTNLISGPCFRLAKFTAH